MLFGFRLPANCTKGFAIPLKSNKKPLLRIKSILDVKVGNEKTRQV